MSTTSVSPDTAPLLSVRGLSRTFVSGHGRRQVVRHAVRDVSFDIHPGESFGLVGESGSGKSTVGRMVTVLTPPTAGEMLFEGRPVPTRGRELLDYRRRVQMVFQDARAALNPRMSVHDLVAEPLVLHRIGDRSSRTARVHELLDQVGLPRAAAARLPGEFSGGQRQRIMIARALALQPSLLVADECVSALDVSVQAQVLNLLKDLGRDLGLAFLFISHNLAVVEFMADTIGVLYQGELVELAPAEQFCRAPQSDYGRSLLAAVPRLEVAS